MKRTAMAAAVVVLVSGCASEPQLDATLTALSRNVYVGADIEQILLAATPMELVAAVEKTYNEILATNFPERAKALAQEIVDADADLVGLQEISLLRFQSPGDASGGGTTPAVDTLQDYLSLLLAELTVRGASYTVAATVQNWDVEMPRANGDDVRLTDFDVLLVKSGIATSKMAGQRFTTRLSVPVASGATVNIWRGWVAVEATIDGITFRVVNTHLESAGAGVRLGQGVELTDMLASETRPIILIGDLNTNAITGTDPTYPHFTGAGYTDAWTLANAGQGLSCCHAPLLDNATSTFSQRIDFVMVRNARSVTAVTADVVGEATADKISGLWPSDHGGVVVTMTVRQ